MLVDDPLKAHLTILRAALAAAGEPLATEDEAAALAEGAAFLAALTPPAVVIAEPARIFSIEDLPRIDSAGLQTVIGQVQFEVLALALAEGPERIIQVVQRNMARRRAAILAADIARLRGTAPPQAVAEARAHVARIAVTLAASGQIVVSEGTEEIEPNEAPEDTLNAAWNLVRR